MAGVSSLWYPPKSPQETGTTQAGPLGTADVSSTPSESGATSKASDDSGGFGFSPTAGFSTSGEQVASAAGLPPAGDPAPRPAQRPQLTRWASWDPSAGSPHGPRTCGRVYACAGSWDARVLADDLAAGLAADPVYDSVDELAWAIRAQHWLSPPRFHCGHAQILLLSRACLASMTAGYQACHRPARHWRNALLYLRSPVLVTQGSLRL